jgi:transcriptional regulator GlxA family with amidase domain
MPYHSGKHAAHTSVRVDIALFNDFELPTVAEIIEIFHKANALAASDPLCRARYDLSLRSAAGGRIASSSSVFVWTESLDSQRHECEKRYLFIAGGIGARRACSDQRLRTWLRRHHPQCEIIHAIDEGLALLDTANLPERPFEAVQSSYVPDPVCTALRIVERDLGAKLAGHVSRSLAPAQHSPLNTPSTSCGAPNISEKILASARWMEANVDRPISMDDAAQVATMSERNFLRRFKNEIGMTPSEYLMRARIDMSCRMLLESRLPVDKIARRCGISDGGQLAKLFRKYLSTTPTDFRMQHEPLSCAASRKAKHEICPTTLGRNATANVMEFTTP